MKPFTFVCLAIGRARCRITSAVGRVLWDPARGGSKVQDPPYTSVILKRALKGCATFCLRVSLIAALSAPRPPYRGPLRGGKPATNPRPDPAGAAAQRA